MAKKPEKTPAARVAKPVPRGRRYDPVSARPAPRPMTPPAPQLGEAAETPRVDAAGDDKAAPAGGDKGRTKP
ncbi:MAG: hypothetical protein Kow00114_35990 [Kiloniellaceae bacterium]